MVKASQAKAGRAACTRYLPYMSLVRVLSHALLCLQLAVPAMAQPVTLADLSDPAKTGDWRFFTDRVMGGLSSGNAVLRDGALHLTGTVSTANNGGFIQSRMDNLQVPEGATSLRLRVQGDGQTYFIHLRTTGTRLPWQYYQAAFVATPDWTEIDLPLSAFQRSGPMLRASPRASDIRSVALVAYGRNHDADVRLSRLDALR